MSYNCKICFKQIDSEDIYDFLVELKKASIEHLKDIAVSNVFYSPLARNISDSDDLDNIPKELRDATIDWANINIFRHRYFYNKKLKLLGVYSVDSSLEYLFDNVGYFQNSCDQDYTIDSWLGVDYFKSVYTKWMNCPVEEIQDWYYKEYEERLDSEDEEYLGYHRRTAAYREIWDNFEYTLFNDDEVIHFCLFGYYDLVHLHDFYNHLVDETKRIFSKLK